MPAVPRNSGFTIVELMMVITIIGILSGVLISVLNYSKHEKDTKDAIIKVNMEKLTTGLETYRTIEGRYPIDSNGDGNPSEDPSLINYIKTGWLDNEPLGAVYKYYTNENRTWMSVTATQNSGSVLKYTSTTSKLMECAQGVEINDDSCPSAQSQMQPSGNVPPSANPFQ